MFMPAQINPKLSFESSRKAFVVVVVVVVFVLQNTETLLSMNNIEICFMIA